MLSIIGFISSYLFSAFPFVFVTDMDYNFQVRTRAVTLQKYISSSDDILKHASNLLKAELPISLRLIGRLYVLHNIVYYLMAMEQERKYG